MTDQLTQADVAELAGISKQSVRQHLKRHTIPEPDGRLAGVPWWHRATIDAWIATRRHPGRPAKQIA
jgi:predicted DNA-binding transcriptional regulator AlpA